MTTKAESTVFDINAHNPSFKSIRESAPLHRTPVDFCVPVNRHFPPPALIREIHSALPEILKYYPDYAQTHQNVVARIAGVPAENIVVANGSSELITLLCERCPGPFATPVPTFGRWTDLPLSNGTQVSFLQQKREEGFALSVEEIIAHVRRHSIRTLTLCNPNNPTGVLIDALDIQRLVDELADLDLLILDESFLDFAGIESAAALAVESANLVVVKSLGKSIGWHGVRLGYAVAREDRARSLRTRMPYWNINGLAAFVLERVAELTDELAQSFTYVRSDREAMALRLAGIQSLKIFPSHANFIFAELPADISGRRLRDRLLTEHGLLVRECSNKLGSTEQFIRFSVNLPGENERLAVALESELNRTVVPDKPNERQTQSNT